MDDFFEITKLSGGAAQIELSVGADDGDAGGIVATVFELSQAFNDDTYNFFRADVAHNPAHKKALLDGPRSVAR